MDGEKPESLIILPTENESQQLSNKTTPKKIFQDLRFLQQFFGKMPDHGNQVIVVNVGEISGASNGDLKESPFVLVEYIESLPQPRLKNLIREACRVSTEKYGSQAAGANFLGTTRRVIGWQLNHPDELKMTVGMTECPEAPNKKNSPVAQKCGRASAVRKQGLYTHSQEWKRHKSATMKAWWKNRKAGGT